MGEPEDEGARLVHVLNRLVTALEPTGSSVAMPEARRGGAAECWEDRDYVSFQISLPGEPQEIDINIHGDKVFIRVDRRTLPARRSGPADASRS
jgi:hypothetical protein